MAADEDAGGPVPIFFLLLFLDFLFLGDIVAGQSLASDADVLVQLKLFLEAGNAVNRGRYTQWNSYSNTTAATAAAVCDWDGVTCGDDGAGRRRVVGLDLSRSSISNTFFHNFSALTELVYLDLSKNYIQGDIHADFAACESLRQLNLSHNLLSGNLRLPAMAPLESIDLTMNRLTGGIDAAFPAACEGGLRMLNLSANRLTGDVAGVMSACRSLAVVDLSSNNFTGELWPEFAGLAELTVSENNFTGEVPGEYFAGCSLLSLDLSENSFSGEFSADIGNCKGITYLNIWGNQFSGRIPPELGSLPELESLLLGKNEFVNDIPDSLINCTNLVFLDVSKMGFAGDVPPIFGRFVQLKYLVLHGNNYTGGLVDSGVLNLHNLIRLDFSFNQFSGELPLQIANISSLRLLVLSYNFFSGEIPAEYGRLSRLQALDLSFNRLTGKIPPAIGNLKSLLWLMLAGNSLSGEIPKEIGNCSSLLWVNLANNSLSGNIPPEMATVGSDPTPTFEANRRAELSRAASGECLAMRRWIPATYPPFSFAYTVLNRKSCRSLWDGLLKGYGLFPMCSDSGDRSLAMTGYIQLTGNQFSGEIPPQLGGMKNFTLLHFGSNRFSGRLPAELTKMPLMVLNVSSNNLSGEIPAELGDVRCLQHLDLSYNNFSGQFPASLSKLNDLNKFNVSYNPLLTGTVPVDGQFATFEANSFLGDPLLVFSSHGLNRVNAPPPAAANPAVRTMTTRHIARFCAILAAAVALFIVFSVYIFARLLRPATTNAASAGYLLYTKSRRDVETATTASADSSGTISGPVKVIQLGKTTSPFTYSNIVTATGNFSDDSIIGAGGFGTVYKGVLSDGKEIAVKKLRRHGPEGEREFRAEMEALTGGDGAWPHPNLVALYGWCLYGDEKLLVYEYMNGGSLDEIIYDPKKLKWRDRLNIAVGVARALVFLHHECTPAVLHRDVKASNVMLDKAGNARLTDFGLARLLVSPEATHVSTMVAGTVGYVAPEYGHMWRATTKGDVYSFGVVLLELATARRAVEAGEEECLVEWVRRVAGDDQGSSDGFRVAMAAVVAAEEWLGEMWEMVRLGVRCTAESPHERPDMKAVLAALLHIGGRDGDYVGQHDHSVFVV